MGKALYRKHRSRKLDEVIGQEHITDTLKNALGKGAISHAYLFTGPKGVGKTSIARILAHEINKIDYDDESIHLDIIEIDAASNRRIDEIRDLRDKVHIAPTSAKYKVYIIDEVHMLTREAFNALLKTLEEPPEHVVFILATTEAHKVPETIISRTQRFTFKPITKSDAEKHLKHIAKKENINITKEALSLIAEHGDGSFRDSISILDQLSGLGSHKLDIDDVTLLLGLPDETIISNIIKSAANKNTAELFDTVRQLKEQGVGSPQAAKSLSSQLRDMLVDDKLEIPKDKTIKLLRDMLPLTTGTDDYLSIELSLLDAMSTKDSKPVPVSQETSKKNKADEQKPRPKNKKSPALVTEPAVVLEEKKENPRNSPQKEPQKRAGKKTTSSKDFDKKAWNEMLNDLKAQHNTLYGVLRMAEPSYKEGQVLITFGFSFHKNRVDEQKNKTAIGGYMKKYFGEAEFNTIVRSKNEKTARSIKQPTIKDDSTIKSVSNIFEGAQLLES